MATHARHVRGRHNEIRVTVQFTRDEYLWVHEGPLSSPFAVQWEAWARQQKLPLSEIQDKIMVHSLPIITAAGAYVGPTILDMMVRGVMSVKDLPTASREAVKAAAKAAGEPAPPVVQTWQFRDPATLWPKPGQSPKAERPKPGQPQKGVQQGIEINDDDEKKEPSHPFFLALASGGRPPKETAATPPRTAPPGWQLVRKGSTCHISSHNIPLAFALAGGLDGAYNMVIQMAEDAWAADLKRAVEIWKLIKCAPGNILIEDEIVAQLRPLCSISQSVERDLGRKLCTWFKVDPDMQINRPQGRPKGKTADQGDVISLSFAEDGVTFIGEITRDYCGHIAKTSLTSLDVFKLAELLGHLRQDKLDVDAEFLEAWLERVAPDWRDQINQAAVNGPAGTWPESCWEVLGVEKADPMEKVAEYFRHSMQTVESLPNGAALQRPIITAYKEIQKYHRTKKGA